MKNLESIKVSKETQQLANQAIKMFGKYGFTEFDLEDSEDENQFKISNPNKEWGSYVTISSGIYETYEYDADFNETTIPAQRWFVVENFGGRGELAREKTLDNLLKEFLTLGI